MMARGIVRLGSRASSPSGATASKPTKASRQKIIPWNAGRTLPSAGMNTLTVFLGALTISSVEMSRKITISMTPRTMPVRVDSETPRYVRNQTRAAHRTASPTHAYWMSIPRYVDRKIAP